MRTLLCIVWLCLCVDLVAFPPDRVPEKPPAPAKEKFVLPKIAGESNWGMVTQAGRSLQINGHASWYAVGEIRPDGRVQLVWTLNDGSRAGIGVYDVLLHEDWFCLTGEWGWGDEVEVDARGNLTGQKSTDRTFRIDSDFPPHLEDIKNIKPFK